MNWKSWLRQALLGFTLGGLAGWGLWVGVLRKPPTDILFTVRAGDAPPGVAQFSLAGAPDQLRADLENMVRPLFAQPSGPRAADVVTGSFSGTVARRAEKGNDIWFSDVADTRAVWAVLGDKPSHWRIERKNRGGEWTTLVEAPVKTPADEVARMAAKHLHEEVRRLYDDLAAHEAKP
jgi:hypothetical protein